MSTTTPECDPGKPLQPACRDYAACTCVDDPATIAKHVFIELSSACNFDCDFCVYRDCIRPRRCMDMDLLAKVLSDLEEVPNIQYVFFSPMGEPLMHPQFAEACRLVKQHGYHLVVTTNGSLLNDGLKELPIDELFISLQTPTKESFELRGAGLAFGDYIRGIREFIRGEMPYSTCIYLMKENRRVFPDYNGLVPSEDADETRDMIVQLLGLDAPDREFNRNGAYVTIGPDLKVHLTDLIEWTRLMEPERMSREEVMPIHDCPYYRHQVNVLVSGDITFCCLDYDGLTTYGNLEQESLAEVIGRRLPGTDLADFSLCRKCRGTPKVRQP